MVDIAIREWQYVIRGSTQSLLGLSSLSSAILDFSAMLNSMPRTCPSPARIDFYEVPHIF